MSDFTGSQELSADDALAAEYAIGTLDDREQRAADSRRRSDASFDRLIHDWNERLAPLLETIPSQQPAGRVWDAVLAEIDRLSTIRRSDQPTASNVVHLRRQVVIWRVASGAAAAIAALLALWIAKDVGSFGAPSSTYLAVLQEGKGGPAFLVSLDTRDHRMTIVPSAVSAEPDKSLELWLIGADQSAPRSLGLVDPVAPVRANLPALDPSLISKATYAITLEPKGGAPDGKPTSAPIYAGHLVEETK